MLGREQFRMTHVFDDSSVERLSPILPDFFTAGASERSVAHDGKAFAEEISPFAQRHTFAGKVKKHATVLIKAVLLEKPNAARRVGEPLLARLHFGKECGEQPSHAPLDPNRLVRVDKLSLTVEATREAAVFRINRVSGPKRYHVIEQATAISVAEPGQASRVCQRPRPGNMEPSFRGWVVHLSKRTAPSIRGNKPTRGKKQNRIVPLRRKGVIHSIDLHDHKAVYSALEEVAYSFGSGWCDGWL